MSPSKRQRTGEKKAFDPSIGKATQFKPGEIHNPTGRPKKSILTDVHEEMLAEKLTDPAFREQFKEAQWAKLLAKGVVSAMTLDKLWERTEGKVTQPVDVNMSLSLAERMEKAKDRVK